MKQYLRLLMVCALSSVLSITLTAQITFNSGSDGSDGALNILSNTSVQLPPDGLFNHTTIDIAAGATLTFTRNDLNTPVYLLATGDVTIAGIIDVSGKVGNSSLGGFGGPGGFDGGMPALTALPPGDGLGPGGGKSGGTGINGAGSGSYGAQASDGITADDGLVYGSPLLIPMVGGSGGGGFNSPGLGGGGGGGGAMLIASNTKIIVDGIIRSRGGSGAGNGGSFATRYNGGSGGAIRLVSLEVTGTGEISVRSMNGPNSECSDCAGPGRIRVDTLLRDNVLGISYAPNSSLSIGAAMVVLPTVLPRLDILEAAGQSIPEGHGNSVLVTLPIGSDPNQDIVIQGRDFTGIVPITIVLTPDNGSSTTLSSSIDLTATNPATLTVNATFPTNVRTHVQVWTQ